jgi:hypothetical protein
MRSVLGLSCARTHTYLSIVNSACQFVDPNPEDVDFEMDREQPTFAESMLGLTPFTTFAEMFDAAQDRQGWDRMAKEQARTIHKKNL